MISGSITDLAVIARSDSDEAVHSGLITMDCFASLAMTIQPHPIPLYAASTL
jgi:hypothetical protein